MKRKKTQSSIYCDLIKDLIPEGRFDHIMPLFPQQNTLAGLAATNAALSIGGGLLAIGAASLPTALLQKILSKKYQSPMITLIDYMDKMIDSMPETKEEIRENVKSRYHSLLHNFNFQLFEIDKITSKDQLLTEYLPLRIACIFCYTFTYENYDKESFDYISDYVEKEYQKIRQDAGNFETYSEMIAFLSNHCIEKDIFVVCKKASVQMKVDKERMKVDFQYITILVFNSMYEASKNDYDDIALPSYSEESFEQETRALLPEGFFLENGKSVRPNTFCKKLKESDSAYVENEIRKAQYITFSKLSEELEQLLNSDTEDEYVVKETILNRISILMELVGYQERTIPKSMQDEFYKVYQLFSKDFLLRIKKYNEQGCIDYLADKSNNEILQIINKDSEAKAIFELCRMMKVICLIESTSTQDYQNHIKSLNINEKHLRAICGYYQALNA